MIPLRGGTVALEVRGMRRSFSMRIRLGVRPLWLGGEEAATAHGAPEDRFHPAAERYRRRRAAFVMVLMGGIALALLSMAFAEPWDHRIGIPGLVCIVGSLAIFFTLPALRCPECQQPADGGFDRYCPACGHAPVRASALLGTHCAACERTMGSYKYRNYPIHYCTHCGTLLDRQGV
jgi:hypothetical protein